MRTTSGKSGPRRRNGAGTDSRGIRCAAAASGSRNLPLCRARAARLWRRLRRRPARRLPDGARLLALHSRSRFDRRPARFIVDDARYRPPRPSGFTTYAAAGCVRADVPHGARLCRRHRLRLAAPRRVRRHDQSVGRQRQHLRADGECAAGRQRSRESPHARLCGLRPHGRDRSVGRVARRRQPGTARAVGLCAHRRPQGDVHPVRRARRRWRPVLPPHTG